MPTHVIFKKLTDKDISLPQYATDGSAGMDICACIDEPIKLMPFCRILIPTGLAVELPENTASMVYPRSGLASKFGITLSNCVGVIDSDYRGEIKIAVVNLSNEPYTINEGDRIAQLVITPVIRAKAVFSKDISDTERGTGGFGSTGK